MRRIVVKVGSGVVTAEGFGALEIDRNTLYRIAGEIAKAAQAGIEVILVSSGAVAMGMEELELSERPPELARVQALAAVGQSQLMRLWREAFGHHGVRVGQVLLTHEDLDRRDRFLNVRATLDSLLGYGAVPVVNENDTVATDEITVGDNDTLASHLAKLLQSDLLVLLTTVDGLLDADGRVVAEVEIGQDPSEHLLAESSRIGRGGMESKLAAADAAVKGGIPVVIANGRAAGALDAALAGGKVGTRFAVAASKLTGRKHWIGYVGKVRGTLHVDAGATLAVRQRGASLLPVGITRVEGDFEVGDVVALVDGDGQAFARGVARSAAAQLAARVGVQGSDPAVHRDDLVLLEPVDP